jgi:hypothetical protein
LRKLTRSSANAQIGNIVLLGADVQAAQKVGRFPTTDVWSASGDVVRRAEFVRFCMICG